MSYSAMQSEMVPPRAQFIAAGITAAVMIAVTVAAAPFGRSWVGLWPNFITCSGAVTLFANAMTAAILFSQAQAARDQSLADLGAAFLFVAGLVPAYLFAFPGVFGGQALMGGPNASVWLWIVWHGGFTAGVIGYAGRRAEQAPAAPRLFRAAARVALLAAAISVATPMAVPHLPALLMDGTFTPCFRDILGPVLMLVNAAALVLVLVRLRGRTATSVWLAVAVLAEILDVCLTTFGHRFNAGWYVAKMLSMGTSCIMLGALLASLSSVFRQIASLNADLFHAAFHDGLTRLPNREMFTKRLQAAMQRAAAEANYRYAVMFIDLDRFKLVNDSLGHRAGDMLLVEVANRLRGCIRMRGASDQGDTLARIGGDEFAVLIDEFDDLSFLTGIADRIAACMQAPAWISGHEIFSSCSVGIVAGAAAYRMPEELLRDADIAMYEAKRAGHGCHAAFVDTMRDGVIAALKLQTDLQNALARDEFFLMYQPICGTSTRAIIGVEALMRWKHAERGLVPPGAFIPAAEETGLIRDMGAWLLQHACQQMQSWHRAFPAIPLRLSVNTSFVELKDPGFTARLRQVLASTGIDPATLQLEITESVFLENAHAVGEILTGIRALGVRVALDDFGTGYSSLSYLDAYPLDTLKIDQSFVARMLSQSRTMAIVQTVVRLGQALSMDIVAEGVETEAQLDVLRFAGCGAVQGFHLGRPMGVAQIELALHAQAELSPRAVAPHRIAPRLVATP